jgi:hypothetical protein
MEYDVLVERNLEMDYKSLDYEFMRELGLF